MQTSSSMQSIKEALESFGISPARSLKGAVLANYPPVFDRKYKGNFRTWLSKSSTQALLSSIDTTSIDTTSIDTTSIDGAVLLLSIRAWLTVVSDNPYDHTKLAPAKDPKLESVLTPARKALVAAMAAITAEFRPHTSDVQIELVGSSQLRVLGVITLRPRYGETGAVAKRLELEVESLLVDTPLLQLEVLDLSKWLTLQYVCTVDHKPKPKDRVKYEHLAHVQKVWLHLSVQHKLPRCGPNRLIV